MRNYFPDPSGWADYQRSRPEYQEVINNFAELLHTKFCRMGHEDSYTWFFEDSWDKFAHSRWQAKAEVLLSSGAPQDLIVDIITEMRTI
jgi:hypothetical protein